jgi:outer membrane protein OmpA-like peptidoglycan-associated protein
MRRIHQIAIGAALALPVLFPAGIQAYAANDRSEEINAIIRNLDVDETRDAVFNIKAARSITINVGVKKHKVMVDFGHSIDLTVFFAYDSDKLTKTGMKELDKLGEALNSKELKPQRFLIAGHTDARGKKDYNLRLSLRRAKAVVNYLVRNWSVDPNRLGVHGWGESRLKDKAHPLAPINRRVEVSYILPPEVVEKTSPAPVKVIVQQPAAPAQVVIEPGGPVRSAGRDCVEAKLNDPRPARAPIDDFGGKRTPIPCGDGASSADRIKVNN